MRHKVKVKFDLKLVVRGAKWMDEYGNDLKQKAIEFVKQKVI